MPAILELRLNPETGRYDQATLEAAASNLQAAGVFGDATQFTFGGVPIGAALIGGLTAGLFDAIINLFPSLGIPGITIPENVQRAILFFVASWAAQTQPVENFLGRGGAQATSLILAADGVNALVDLRGILGGLFGGGTLAARRGLTGRRGMAASRMTANAATRAMGAKLEQVPAIALGRQQMAGL